ncbi:MAG: hypothetical protein M3464_18570 [Chloroflexota bacterium]|nr:hypothetical protein [Chloroflexota bacterium]
MTSSSVPVPAKAGDTAVAEVGSDLQATLVGYMDFTVTQWRLVLADVSKQYEAARWKPEGERERIKELLDFTRQSVDALERVGTDGPGYIEHLALADYSWHNVMDVWSHDEQAGRALWERIRQTARDELAVGKTGAEAVEGYHERPMRRAEYLAVWVALADGLKPANGAERLLIDGMAQALIMHRHWLHRMVQLDSIDEGRLKRAASGRERYEPPRLSEVEAVDRAAQMADRFQRQFLRLMKCYRDGRRLIASMTVLGGQVNVAEQQINVTAEARIDADD